MQGLSNYLMQKLLDHATGNAAYTIPTSLTIHLYKDDPGPADTGNEVSDTADDTAYAAQTMSMAVAAVDGADAWKTANDAVETFAAVVYGSGAAPYVVTHGAVKDQLGNIMWYGPLPASVTRNVGEPFSFPIGATFTRLNRSA